MRLAWQGNSLDLTEGPDGLRTEYVQRFSQNRAANKKAERINQASYLMGTCDFYIFGSSEYDRLNAWWSFARQGNEFEFALSTDKMTGTSLTSAITAGSTFIKVNSKGAFSTGDQCILTSREGIGNFEAVEVSSVSTSSGIKINLTQPVMSAYSEDDYFRHKDYFPNIISLDDNFVPNQLASSNHSDGAIYRYQLKFFEVYPYGGYLIDHLGSYIIDHDSNKIRWAF